MRRPLLVFALLMSALVAPALLDAQTLRQRFTQLYTFGDCGTPMCLSGVGPGSQHGEHYNPSATQGEANMLGFVSGSIARSITNLPFTSSAGGVSFTLIDGSLVATSSSYGGIFGERSQTLGKGRIMAGASLHGLSMNQLRGVPMRDLMFRFAHQNVGGALMGDPVFENDIIEVHTNLKVNLFVTSAFLSYGVSNDIDIGIQLPFVRASISGSSDAVITPWDRTQAPHSFGTPTAPAEYAEVHSSGSAAGIGDIAVRAKANVYQTTNLGVAFAADIRLPTGDSADFLGAGQLSARVMGIASAKTGDFSPHLNLGYVYRAGDSYGNSVVGAVGFDHLLAERVTLAADILADFQIGESPLRLPGSVIFETPVRRKMQLTEIPEMKDHLIDASVGFKFQLPSEYRLITNLLIPMSDGGMRPKFVWTTGFERTF